MRSIKTMCILLAAILILAMLPARPALAKGLPGKIKITGPGLKTPIEITDKTTQTALSLTMLEDLNTSVTEVPSVGEAFEIVQYMDEPTEEDFVLSRRLYFPGAAGQRGILFSSLDLGIDRQRTTVGRWYYLKAQSETLLTALLAKSVTKADSPSRIETRLEPTPQDCKDTTKLDNSESVVGQALELTAVSWVTGFSGPRAALNIMATAPVKHGWRAPVRWMSLEFVTMPITIFGRNVADNSQVWFQVEGQQPTTALVLSPKNAPVTTLHKGWLEYPAAIFVPKAGCYVLDIHWGKISSEAIFAAGRASNTDGT